MLPDNRCSVHHVACCQTLVTYCAARSAGLAALYVVKRKMWQYCIIHHRSLVCPPCSPVQWVLRTSFVPRLLRMEGGGVIKIAVGWQWGKNRSSVNNTAKGNRETRRDSQTLSCCRCNFRYSQANTLILPRNHWTWSQRQNMSSTVPLTTTDNRTEPADMTQTTQRPI
jgi:hypothetical protein